MSRPVDLDDLTPRQVRAFRRSLLRFYDEHRRDLPWRRTQDPYAILVSEVMLQQTRVETVVPYYERWIARFPSVGALAEAETDEVLKLWEGLGYYARARNLHRAVREIEARYDGRIPGDPLELRGLPGIGAYTAGAVASIAFEVPVPAVDGNVRRVLARVADDPAPPLARLEHWASCLVDPDRPGEFNQALMELGSTLCTPRAPTCGSCPVSRWCRARRSGTVEMRPRRNPKRGVPTVTEAVVILVDRVDRADGAWRILLRKRPEQGLLAGMWELPGRPVRSRRDTRAEVLDLAWELVGAVRRRKNGVRSVPEADDAVAGLLFGHEAVALPPLKHAFSHRRVRYLPFLVSVDGACRDDGPESGVPRTGGGASGLGSGRPVGGALRWIHRGEESDLALPSAQRELLRRAWDQFPELARIRWT